MGRRVEGSYSGRGKNIFLSCTISRETLGPLQPPIQLERGFFPRVKVAGIKGNHCLPPGAVFKNECSCTRDSHMSSLCGQGNCTFKIYCLWFLNRFLSLNFLLSLPPPLSLSLFIYEQGGHTMDENVWT